MDISRTGMREKLILIVEDLEDDIGVLEWTLKKAGIVNPVFCLRDGHEALLYLSGAGTYQDRTMYPVPAVLFLDLKLPLLDGWEVLDWIHGGGIKGDMKIFIYSQPKSVSEVLTLYNKGADTFLSKPVEEEDLMNVIRHFPTPWAIKPSSVAAETLLH